MAMSALSVDMPGRMQTNGLANRVQKRENMAGSCDDKKAADMACLN